MKSPGNLRTLAATQTSLNDNQLTLIRKRIAKSDTSTTNTTTAAANTTTNNTGEIPLSMKRQFGNTRRWST